MVRVNNAVFDGTARDRRIHLDRLKLLEVEGQIATDKIDDDPIGRVPIDDLWRCLIQAAEARRYLPEWMQMIRVRQGREAIA